MQSYKLQPLQQKNRPEKYYRHKWQNSVQIISAQNAAKLWFLVESKIQLYEEPVIHFCVFLDAAKFQPILCSKLFPCHLDKNTALNKISSSNSENMHWFQLIAASIFCLLNLSRDPHGGGLGDSAFSFIKETR